MNPIIDSTLPLQISEPLTAIAEQDRLPLLAFGPVSDAPKNTETSESSVSNDWPQLQIRAKQRWPKLLDHELSEVNGKAENLVNLLKLRYNLMPADAESQVEQFFLPVVETKRRDDFNGLWLQHMAAAKTRWNKLNIKELEQCNGIKQSLVNLVSRRYKLTPEDARRQVSQFILKCIYESNKAAS